MEIKTYRAKTMQQALQLVRSELGPEANVLHTRELNSGLMKRMLLGRQYEIAATPATALVHASPTEQQVASFEVETPDFVVPLPVEVEPSIAVESPAQEFTGEYRQRYRDDLLRADRRVAELQALVEQLQEQRPDVSQAELPAQLFELFTELVEADLEPDTARELIERVRTQEGVDLHSSLAVRAQVARMIEAELPVTGPIATGPIVTGSVATDQAKPRVVALVGPTGVGKTTTIAKLAADYRLRKGLSVGLITVDTYRIAAVEQLRTYAEIIDLPMEIVSTPLEMRAAVEAFAGYDLVLLDTAGRSPRDETKVAELQTVLAEAEPDEVQLVLSAVSSGPSLVATAERFAPVGITSLLVTKLDEALSLGNIHSLVRSSKLPLSYVTNGQNVPDDIRVAEPRELAMAILGMHAEF
ncbi:flagellar biosynthesis protein FlhF [Adhaeretor mobilis]|uniref:Flagellar biosynthesis protein FlhF n=1 Tax=Adhaeretor mobilis TaxID=1930276 RepID=A0A517MYV3_9BACT|nr:flagellar biosynthesis protein FlhF [Adhaeretor mobilis]QDT00066.1 Flagellar biosynthesis protein FlhF [Adhaeretor mobilis]